MSQTPIFDQLVDEFAAKGAVYNEFVKWIAPAFEWRARPVVQLDKQPSYVFITEVVDQTEIYPKPENIQISSRENGDGTVTLKVDGLQPKALGVVPDSIRPVSDFIESGTPNAIFDRFVQDYALWVSRNFSEQYPQAVITETHAETKEDGSATLVIEAVQPIFSVMPLSEKNSVEPME